MKLNRYPDPETLVAHWEELAAPLMDELTPVEQVEIQILIGELAESRMQRDAEARTHRLLAIMTEMEKRRAAA